MTSSIISSLTRSASPVKLIATDIDGTMLRDDGSLSPRVRKAMHAAVDAGIPVVPATGRPLQMGQDIIEASGLDGYWVYANGSLTRHEGRNEDVRAFYIDFDTAVSAIEAVRASLPNCGFAIEFNDRLAYESHFADVVPEALFNEGEDDILEPVLEARERGAQIVKLLAFDTSQFDMNELQKQIDIVTDGALSSTNSGLRFVELAAEEISKAYALDLLVKDLGIASSEVAAFGDNQNDLAMLRWAGHSFAMANGTDDARATAGGVIGSNEDDALAVAIEEILAAQS
jgi:Cof subfamily protein (haloacid dehalogenase superfamily)